MSIHLTVLEIGKMLRNLDACVEKALAHAEERKFDPKVLLQSRLAPDMFPLIRQIQLACDNARWAAARTAGKETPAQADDEQTLGDLRGRIAAVAGYLEGFSPADFAGADERLVSLPRWGGMSMTGSEYFYQHGLPNFFFHLVTAYALLRHNGVPLGKRDYLGNLPLR